MGLNEKNNENNGFTLIELVVVIGILSILSSISLSYFNGVNRRAREVAAQNALLTIKKECETNYAYSLPLFFEDKRLQKYSITSNGQNSCYGDLITGLVSAVPEEKDLSPYYHYNFNNGELSCSYKNGEKFYLQGLKIDPKHIGINEYLGELYVATNRHNLAVERLEVLKDCNCKEYDQLKAVIAGEKSKY